MLKIEKPTMKFSELDAEYQNHFYRMYLLTALLFLVSIPLCIIIGKYIYILVCFLIALGFAGYLYSQIYKSLIGTVMVYDLECVDIKRHERSLFGSKDAGSKTCTMTLKAPNEMFFVQEVPFSSPYKVGDVVRIYSDKNSVTQMNTNTFSIMNPIFMHVLASSSLQNEN